MAGRNAARQFQCYTRFGLSSSSLVFVGAGCSEARSQGATGRSNKILLENSVSLIIVRSVIFDWVAHFDRLTGSQSRHEARLSFLRKSVDSTPPRHGETADTEVQKHFSEREHGPLLNAPANNWSPDSARVKSGHWRRWIAQSPSPERGGVSRGSKPAHPVVVCPELNPMLAAMYRALCGRLRVVVRLEVLRSDDVVPVVQAEQLVALHGQALPLVHFGHPRWPLSGADLGSTRLSPRAAWRRSARLCAFPRGSPRCRDLEDGRPGARAALGLLPAPAPEIDRGSFRARLARHVVTFHVVSPGCNHSFHLRVAASHFCATATPPNVAPRHSILDDVSNSP